LHDSVISVVDRTRIATIADGMFKMLVVSSGRLGSISMAGRAHWMSQNDDTALRLTNALLRLMQYLIGKDNYFSLRQRWYHLITNSNAV
jgi:hypothetical protein